MDDKKRLALKNRKEFAMISVQGKELNYLLYAHEDYKKEKLPLVVFLHGAGERGDTLETLPKVAIHGVPSYLDKTGAKPRCVAVCPQCPADSFWIADVQRILRFVDEVEAEYGTDPARVALTGISMGGFGTWITALAAPKRFWRIAPVCGGGMPWAAGTLTMPIRAFHGDADSVVLPSNSIDMIDMVQRGGNKDALLTLYHNVGHNSWEYAYDGALMAFLLGE